MAHHEMIDPARALSVVKCVWEPPIPPVAFFHSQPVLKSIPF